MSVDGRGLLYCRSAAVGSRRVGWRAGQHRSDGAVAVDDSDGAATYGNGGGVRIVVGTGVCGCDIWVFVRGRGDAWRRSTVKPKLGGVVATGLGGRYSLCRGRIICGLCRGCLVFGFVRGRLVHGAAASAAKDEEGGSGATDDEHAGNSATDGARG